MSSQLKTAIVVDDSLIFDGNNINAANHNNPLQDAQAQLREGQASVSSGDTHVKHLEDAIVGTANKVQVTKQNTGANESLAIDLDATGVTNGYIPTANGSGGWSWASPGGGGAQPIDVTGEAGEDLALRDYVYLDESSNTWFKVDVDASPIACGRFRGIVHDSAITATNTGSIRLLGEISGYAGLTAGQPVYASATPGLITQTRPSPTSGGAQVAIILIGLAISATNIIAMPPTPILYMKRDNALANEGALTIEHHADEMGHTRRAMAYIGSSEAGTSLTSYNDTNQDADLNLKDIEITAYTADQCTGGSATASSNTAGVPASDAFADNGNATGDSWATASGQTTGWLKYDFGASNEKTIRRYTIIEQASEPDRAPNTWTFEGSNNDSDWDVLDSVSGFSTWGGSTETFDFYNDVAYRYYRINISANNGDGSFLAIGEMEMMEASTTANGNEFIAQSFQIGSASDVEGITLYLKKVGSPTGNLTIEIQPDSTGDPSGTPVTNGTSDAVAASTLTESYTDIEFTFSTPPSLSSATTYWIVLKTADTYSETDYVQWGIDSSTPGYANGETQEYNGSWAAVGADAVFSITAPGTTFVEPAVMGRWAGGTRDVAIRYDDGAGNNGNTNTTCKNVIGAEADVTLVVEVP